MTLEYIRTELATLLRLAKQSGEDEDVPVVIENAIETISRVIDEREDQRLWDTGQHHELRMREEARAVGKAA